MTNYKNKNNRSFGSKTAVSQSAKKERVVIGLHAIREAIKVRKNKITKVLLKKEWRSSADLSDIANTLKKSGVLIEERTQENLDKFGAVNQGVVCFIDEVPKIDWEKIYNMERCILLFLDGVEDPHNLGAIMRTAWLMNVAGIIVPSERAVGLTTTVHKVASGGVEHVPLETTVNFTNIINKLKENGFWVYGLSGDAKKSIYNLDLPQKIVWILGAEDKGMRVTTEKLCDDLAYIPQSCNASSYNVSVSAGIALGETFRQHSLKK